MTPINKPLNSVFIFPKGTSAKMKEKAKSKRSVEDIRKHAELLRKNLSK